MKTEIKIFIGEEKVITFNEFLFGLHRELAKDELQSILENMKELTEFLSKAT